MRNVFNGGPNDGEVHLSFDLLTDDKTRASIPWEEYYHGEQEPAVDGEIPILNWYHLGDTVVPTEAPKPTAGPTAPKADKSDLRLRREALKVKRQELADQSGITIGVLARLETKGGTEEELAPVLARLAELEGSPADEPQDV